MPVLQVLCFIMLWTDQICNSNPQRKHPGHDETLFEVHTQTTLLCMAI